MSIHREGRISILIALLITAVGSALMWWLVPVLWLNALVTVLLVACLALVLWFFRIPARTQVHNDTQIIAPADGKVVAIERITEGEYLHAEAVQISIFMSPLNVHVQYYPISGPVVYQAYHPGKYLVAWHPKSSTLNERTTVVVQHARGQVLFRQIAGAMARRIVCYAKQGQQAQQGQEAGFIKFGSRVDVIVPPHARITVQLNQKTQAGITPLAEW
jgi:phosphatidylserine decarboxylase